MQLPVIAHPMLHAQHGAAVTAATQRVNSFVHVSITRHIGPVKQKKKKNSLKL